MNILRDFTKYQRAKTQGVHMMKNNNKKKTSVGQYLSIILFMIFGGVCGWLMTSYVINGNADTLSERFLYMIAMLVFMYMAVYFQIIIHEAGHLIFGLLTGYGFASFRIMSFMWVKENGRLKFSRLAVNGTAGQCIMTPPSFNDGNIPVALYNLGGVLMNIITGILFLGFYYVFGQSKYLSGAMLLLSVGGFIIAFMNGLPLNMGAVNNDGHNLLSILRSPKAVRAFWVQLKVSEQGLKGLRLKEMPAEWFAIPDDEEMKNSIIAVMGVFACNRLMDEGRFDEADSLMSHILEIDSGVMGLHRSMLMCDRIYCELITSNRSDILTKMLTKQQLQFMKAMKKFPSILRTEYAYALIAENDAEKAEKIKGVFDKCAKDYAYPGDIVSERVLMDIALEKYSEKGAVDFLR